MPPKQANKDTPTKAPDEDVNFLLSCLMHVEPISWPEIAKSNGITGTASLGAPQAAQRKFKRLVDASGKYTLEKGKITLKDQAATTTTTKKTTNAAAAEEDDEDEGEEVPATPDSPTPAPKSTGKKRGRPRGSVNKKSAKKAKTGEDVGGDDEE